MRPMHGMQSPRKEPLYDSLASRVCFGVLNSPTHLGYTAECIKACHWFKMTGGNKPKNMIKMYSNISDKFRREHHKHRNRNLVKSAVPAVFVDMHLHRKTTTTSLTRPRPSNNRNSAQCIRTLDGHAWLTSQCSNSMLIESDEKAVLMSELFAHTFRLDDLAVYCQSMRQS